MGQPSESSDEDLASRVAAGLAATAAFNELFNRYNERLLRFLRAKTDNVSDAEDLATDVWMRVWKHLPRWERQHFRGWLFTISRRVVLDHFDRARLRRTQPLQAAENVVQREAIGFFSDEVAKLKACLNLLREEFRTAILGHSEGYSSEEQAERLGIPAETVRSRVHRAKHALQECMGANSQ